MKSEDVTLVSLCIFVCFDSREMTGKEERTHDCIISVFVFFMRVSIKHELMKARES